MKRIFICIIAIVIIIVSVVLVNYIEYSQKLANLKKLNQEYLMYENTEVQINTIVSLMNKAIQHNTENNIEQNEDKIFKENDTNSIKIYLETKSSGGTQMVQVPMEQLILNENAGVEKVEYAFSDLTFKMTNVEYHEKTGQVKKIVFTAQE